MWWDLQYKSRWRTCWWSLKIIYNPLDYIKQNRSNTIKNTLIENGIQDSRLNTRAFGEHNPGYPEIPLSERKKNRRVILSINMDL